MKSIALKITIAVSLLLLGALLLETYLSGEMIGYLFYEYMSKAAVAGDPYPLMEGGRLVAGPIEKAFVGSIYSRLIWITAPVTVLAFVTSYAIARMSTKSIRALSRGVNEIAKGNLGYKIESKESGEVGTLVKGFNSMADELARDQTLRKQFFADAAHELKTPIAVIKGNIEGMLDDVIAPNKETLSSLLEEVDYLGGMVGNMKYLALADSGYLTLNQRSTNINDIISLCIKRLMPSAVARDLKVTTEYKTDPLIAFIDPERITQIIDNLLINAGKYTPHGGSIGAISERFVKNGVEHFKVTIWDTGQGISKDDLPYVFDRFYRADKSRTKKTGGIGLGLSIVKKLTELHNGQVSVTSELDNGSRFVVAIPTGGAHAQ